jgi:hypothetical protein
MMTSKRKNHENDESQKSIEVLSVKRMKDHKDNNLETEVSHGFLETNGRMSAEVQTVKRNGEFNSQRWKSHRLLEEYVDAVGNIMYPDDIRVNPYSDGLERATALGYLTSPLRRRTIWEDWSPREVALFEAALTLYGKQFSKIADKYLANKNTKDVVAFYYIWKKTQRYKEWKLQYEPDDNNSKEDWIVQKIDATATSSGGKSK